MLLLPEKLAGNRYQEVPRILVRPQIKVLLLFLQNLRSIAYFQLINFEIPIKKSNFDMYHTVTMSNFPQKIAEEKYARG